VRTEHRVYVALVLVLLCLICSPTEVRDLPAALRAAAGHGIAGPFRLDTYNKSGKSGYWWGGFRSKDGRTVLPLTRLDGMPSGTPKGTEVPAFIVTTRHSIWGSPTAYTGKNMTYLWLPLVSTLYWSGLIVAAVVWVRNAVRRRRPAPPPPQAHLPPPDPGNVRALGMWLRRRDR
jgi:hypothetical protein